MWKMPAVVMCAQRQTILTGFILIMHWTSLNTVDMLDVRYQHYILAETWGQSRMMMIVPAQQGKAFESVQHHIWMSLEVQSAAINQGRPIQLVKVIFTFTCWPNLCFKTCFPVTQLETHWSLVQGQCGRRLDCWFFKPMSTPFSGFLYCAPPSEPLYGIKETSAQCAATAMRVLVPPAMWNYSWRACVWTHTQFVAVYFLPLVRWVHSDKKLLAYPKLASLCFTTATMNIESAVCFNIVLEQGCQ